MAIFGLCSVVLVCLLLEVVLVELPRLRTLRLQLAASPEEKEQRRGPRNSSASGGCHSLTTENLKSPVVVDSSSASLLPSVQSDGQGAAVVVSRSPGGMESFGARVLIVEGKRNEPETTGFQESESDPGVGSLPDVAPSMAPAEKAVSLPSVSTPFYLDWSEGLHVSSVRGSGRGA